MATGIGSPLALGGLYPSVDGRYVAANGKPFTSVSNAESALNGFPSKLSESCVGLTVLVADENDPDYPKAKEYWVQPKGTTPETYGLVEKGAGTTDYADLDNKPTISDGGQGSAQIPLSGNVKVTATAATSGQATGVAVTAENGGITMAFTLEKGTDGKSAYQQWLDEGNTGDETDFLNSLKAHVSRFIPIATEAGATSLEVGDTYAFSNVTNPTDGAMLLMPNGDTTTPKTLMFSVTSNGDTPETFTYTYVGELAISTEGFLSSNKIVQDLTTGGAGNVPSAEAVKGLKEDLYGRTTVEETAVNIEGLPTYPRQFYYVADGDLEARAYSCISGSDKYSPYLSLASYRGKRLRVVGNLNSSYVYMTFVTGSTPYASPGQPLSWLVQQNVLSSIHQDPDTKLWNPVIRLARGGVWEGNIPDDAGTLYFTTWTLNTEGTLLNVQHVLPSAITIIDVQRTPGDIDTLQQEVEELQDVVVQSAGAGIAFAPGTMTEDGDVVDADNILISAPVALTDGYFLQVTPQYRIYRVHTIDTVSGRMVDFAGEHYIDSVAEAAAKTYVLQSNAKAMAGYAHVIEVVRADAGEVSPDDKVVSVFFTRRHLRAMGYSRISPQNTAGVQGITDEVYRRFLRRSDMVQRVVWPTLAPVYASNYSNRTARFHAGIESIGINYSEASEWSKYVPNHVTLRTYLTALLNRHSVMYTEKIDGAINESKYGFSHHSLNSYAGAYYGTVCTGFTTYLLGLADVRVSANWGNNTWAINNFKLIAGSADANLDYNDVVSLIQPMDFFWNSGHCWACKEVFVNDDGERVFVIVEQTTPVAKERFYTAERLIARLKGYTTALNGYTWKILRYKDWTAYPATDTPDWAGVTHDNMRFPLPPVWDIDPDISTFAGEYAAFLIGDSSDSYNNAKLFLNARRGGEYTTLQIYLETDNPDAEPQTTPVDTIDLTGQTEGDRASYAQETIYTTDAQDQDDWLRIDLTTRAAMKAAGKYKARLVGAGQVTSGWTHFLLASIENLACTKSSSAGKDRLDSFSVIGGKPYLVRDENLAGMAAGGRVRLEENSHFSLDESTGAWRLTSPVEMASGGTCIKLYVQTDYGVVVKRVSLT